MEKLLEAFKARITEAETALAGAVYAPAISELKSVINERRQALNMLIEHLPEPKEPVKGERYEPAKVVERAGELLKSEPLTVTTTGGGVLEAHQMCWEFAVLMDREDLRILLEALATAQEELKNAI